MPSAKFWLLNIAIFERYPGQRAGTDSRCTEVSKSLLQFAILQANSVKE